MAQAACTIHRKHFKSLYYGQIPPTTKLNSMPNLQMHYGESPYLFDNIRTCI